jgi:hypothetical protein
MRTIAHLHQPTERHRWSQKTPSAEPGALPGVRRIEVVSPLTARWGSLDARVRRPVECLFEGAPVASGVTFAVDGDLPLEFLCDLVCGGGAFRDAFPALVRRVVEIRSCDDLVTVRVVCEGDHTGTFFELLSPTHRSVCFDVVHRLALRDALPREDRIALDMRRIISQLVAPTPSPPLPSLATSRHPRK